MAVEYQLAEQFRFVPGRRILERIPDPDSTEGPAIALPARAIDLLAVLVRERHRAVSKDDLTAEVWAGVSVTPNNLNQCITALRKALGDTRQAPRYIATIPNVGYQFVASVVEVNAEPKIEPAELPPAPQVMAHRRMAIIAIGLCFAAMVIASRWYPLRPDRNAISATPFENLQKDEDYDWLAAALSEFVVSGYTPVQNARYAVRGSYAVSAPGRVQVKLSILEDDGGGKVVGTSEGSTDLIAFPELLQSLSSEAGRSAGLILTPRNGAATAFAEGIDEWRKGELTKARTSLRQAVFLDPRQPQNLSALGAVLLEMGRTAEARALQERAMQLARETGIAPQHPEIEGRYFASRGEWAKGTAGLQAQWTKHPDQAHDALELAYAQFRASQTDAAMSTLQALARLHPEAAGDPRILLLNARLQGQYGNMSQVRDIAARAAAAARSAKLAWVEGRAMLLQAGAVQNLGAYDEATKIRTAAVRLCQTSDDGPCVAAAKRIEGNLHLGLGRLPKAVECYRAALERSRRDGNVLERLQALNGLAHALMQNSQHHEAEVLLRAALERDLAMAGLNPAAVSNSLAETLIAQGRYREGQIEAENAIRFGTATGDKETVARAYLNAAEAGGADPSSEVYYEKAVENFRQVGNPEQSRLALLRYARFLRAKGDRVLAGQRVAEASKLPTELHQDLLAEVEASLRANE